MVHKNTISNNKRKNSYKNPSFRCPSSDFRNCPYYNGNEKIESHCIKDSNFGYCIPEKEALDFIEIYYNEYNKSRGITKNGDTKC